MFKQILFFLAMAVITYGCGNESRVESDIGAEKLACTYGDCKHIIRSVTFPLDNPSMAYNTPLPGLGPIAGGILKLVGDIFTNSNMGKVEMSYTQPIPSLPKDILYSVRLKRFFFYMKPTGRGRWFNFYKKGKRNTTFDFLDKLAVRLSTTKLENPDTYVSMLRTDKSNKKSSESLMRVFSNNYYHRVVDTEVAEDVILFKYNKKTKHSDTANDLYGNIHYLETTKDPQLVKAFFLNQASFKGYYKRILLLSGSILIELEKDPVSNEIFEEIMAANAEEIEALGVNFYDTCNAQSCLEINVPDINIMPIANKGNAVELEALLQADRVPESFKLKGFVEFEVKVDSII